jgi:nucleoside-diphosphate-sugar epimerase
MIDNNGLHVVFGTGPVGMAVADELVGRGRRVRLVNRGGKAAPPKGAEVVRGDARDPAFTRKASAGAAVVYNALNPPYDKWTELFPPLQAGVIEGAAASGARLVVIENLYMYGSPGGRPMTEDLPHAPNTRKGEVRARMSEELMEAHTSGRVRVAIGRASDFFGPRVLTSAAGEQVFGRAVQGKSAQVAGDPGQPHTYTYMPDIGRGLAILGGTRRSAGAGVAPAQPRDGLYAPVRRDGIRGGRRTGEAAKGAEATAAGVGHLQPRDTRDHRDALRVRRAVLRGSPKFARAFGDHATPLQDAIRRTVRWYRQRGF